MKFDTTILEDNRSSARRASDHPDTSLWEKAEPDYVHIPDCILHRGPRAFMWQAVWRAAVLALPILVTISALTAWVFVDPDMLEVTLVSLPGILVSIWFFHFGCDPIQSLRDARMARRIKDQRITPADAQTTRELLELFDRLGIPYEFDRAPEELTNSELSQLAKTLNARAVEAQRCVRQGKPIAQAASHGRLTEKRTPRFLVGFLAGLVVGAIACAISPFVYPTSSHTRTNGSSQIHDLVLNRAFDQIFGERFYSYVYGDRSSL
jgi:hypothetical protein